MSADFLYRKGIVHPFEFAALDVYALGKQDLIQLLALVLEARGYDLTWEQPKPPSPPRR